MLGVNDSDDFKKLMRLYLMLHSDHEGGNVSAFSSLTVASSLSSPFLALGATEWFSWAVAWTCEPRVFEVCS